tara:strand:- start:208339 stop:209616 length:1278 start_codon:yes stop_codon:yes gene_type:complete
MSITAPQSNVQYLQSLNHRAGARVQNAVQSASHKTGVDFAYLMEQAAAESNFDHDAKATTSSASGLYQFIDSTWLAMVKDHGDKYGLGQEAATINAQGRVSDPAMRASILALRDDPKIASLMAAELAADNKAYLSENFDGDIGSTELYMAHFLGAGKAAEFLNAEKDNPSTIGAQMFPREAGANPNVFFDKQTGSPRSLEQIYTLFDDKFRYDDVDFAQTGRDQQDSARATTAPSIPPLQTEPSYYARRNLRNFVGAQPFVADQARARALGARVESGRSQAQPATSSRDGSLTSTAKTTLQETAQRIQGTHDTKNTMGRQVNAGAVGSELSLFEQLQYRSVTRGYSRTINAPKSIDQNLTENTVQNTRQNNAVDSAVSNPPARTATSVAPPDLQAKSPSNMPQDLQYGGANAWRNDEFVRLFTDL